MSGLTQVGTPIEDTSRGGRPTVAVIILVLKETRFLADAIASVFAQNRQADEIIVVDGASPDDTIRVLAQFPNVRLIAEPQDRGPSAALNVALRNCRSDHVVFLDARDRLLPAALETGLDCIARSPAYGFVYGAFRHISNTGAPLGPDIIAPVEGDAHLAFLRRNLIDNLAVVLFRRDCLLAVGGFDETLQRLKDHDLYLRIAARYPVASHYDLVAECRDRGRDAAQNGVAQMKAALRMLDRQRALIAHNGSARAALRIGRANIRDEHASKMLAAARAQWRASRNLGALVGDLLAAACCSPRVIGCAIINSLRYRTIGLVPPRLRSPAQQYRRFHQRLQFAIHRVRPAKPKPVILMYHRIVDDTLVQSRYAVSPSHFAEHLEVLRRTRYPLALADFVRHHLAGTLRPDAVAVTFDDGYADNLHAGKPRLAKADVPATVFLATGYLDRAGEFWWDELSRLILLGHGPRRFDIVVGGQTKEFDIGTEPWRADDGIGSQIAPTSRSSVLATLSQLLRPLEDEERGLIVRHLRSMFSIADDHESLGRPMTSAEAYSLAADGLVTIGAHSVTHPVLSLLGPVARRHEIRASKQACEALLGAHVTAFAYPYGDFNANVREEVRLSGFAFACATERSAVVAASDLFALPRVYVGNWNGEDFERALRLDPAFA